MKIAAVQFAPAFGEVEANLRTCRNLVSSVEADLYVLPELALSGYLFESPEEAHSLAQDPEGSEIGAFADLAAERGSVIVVGFAERAGEAVFNSSVLVGPDGRRSVYRKIHLFYPEKDVFLPGDRPFEVVEAAGVRLGMMICFDWIFPESARSLALQGAEILCHPANLVLPYCQDAMVTRALENRVFAVTANRTGTEERVGKELTFTGLSEIVAPNGEILAKADTTGEAVITAEIDPGRARDKAVTPRNDAFGDRRPELYRLD